MKKYGKKTSGAVKMTAGLPMSLEEFWQKYSDDEEQKSVSKELNAEMKRKKLGSAYLDRMWGDSSPFKVCHGLFDEDMQFIFYHKDQEIGHVALSLCLVGAVRSELKSGTNKLSLTWRFIEPGSKVAPAFLARRVRIVVEDLEYSL